MRQYFERKDVGNGFAYYRRGHKISNAEQIERIESLSIPPAWTEVRIAVHPRAKVQVEGRDASGKKQSIYSAQHVASQAAAKFDRTVQFALKLPTLRRRIKQDLKRRRYDKEKVIACAVALMDKAYIRVGNEKYAKEHASYGLTTLRRKHVVVSGETIIFDFIGKSGKNQHIEVKDETIARTIRRLDDLSGYELFRYYNARGELTDLKSDDVNRYIRDVMGDSFSAKDFRTWGGTMLAASYLAGIERSGSDSGRQKDIVASVKYVAETLGNTPAVARDAYIDPFVFKLYESSDSIARVFARSGRFKPVKYLRRDEQSVIRLLAKKRLSPPRP